jgi:hypothetical protein
VTRTARLGLRLTPDQKRALESAAAAHGQSVSAYVLTRCLSDSPSPRVRKAPSRRERAAPAAETCRHGMTPPCRVCAPQQRPV